VGTNFCSDIGVPPALVCLMTTMRSIARDSNPDRARLSRAHGY
jgi:hypothetical protein